MYNYFGFLDLTDFLKIYLIVLLFKYNQQEYILMSADKCIQLCDYIHNHDSEPIRFYYGPFKPVPSRFNVPVVVSQLLLHCIEVIHCLPSFQALVFIPFPYSEIYSFWYTVYVFLTHSYVATITRTLHIS